MDSQWLKTQFELNPGKTKAGLAKAIGLEPPAISKILKGTRQVKAQEYASMREYFGLPTDGSGASKRKSESFVITELTKDNGVEDAAEEVSDTEWVIPADILSQRTAATPEQVKIFQIKESTMEPEFRRDEHVVVDLSDTNPSPPGVFVVSDGFGFLIRQCEFLPNSDPPEIMVSAKDQSFQSQKLKLNEFKIIGRVLAKLQWL